MFVKHFFKFLQVICFYFCILDLTEMTTKYLTTLNEKFEKLKNNFQGKLK